MEPLTSAVFTKFKTFSDQTAKRARTASNSPNLAHSIIIGQFYGLLIRHATEYFTSHNFAVESLEKVGALSASMYMIKAFGIGALSVLIPAVIIVAITLSYL